MHPDRSVNPFTRPVIAALLVLGLCLTLLATATGWRRLSASWDAACHHVFHAPSAPSFAAPWRLSEVRSGTPCLRRP